MSEQRKSSKFEGVMIIFGLFVLVYTAYVIFSALNSIDEEIKGEWVFYMIIGLVFVFAIIAWIYTTFKIEPQKVKEKASKEISPEHTQIAWKYYDGINRNQFLVLFGAVMIIQIIIIFLIANAIERLVPLSIRPLILNLVSSLFFVGIVIILVFLFRGLNPKPITQKKDQLVEIGLGIIVFIVLAVIWYYWGLQSFGTK